MIDKGAGATDKILSTMLFEEVLQSLGDQLVHGALLAGGKNLQPLADFRGKVGRNGHGTLAAGLIGHVTVAFPTSCEGES